jgi:septal ring factor EnvC (AmiA/AmiB activator)
MSRATVGLLALIALLTFGAIGCGSDNSNGSENTAAARELREARQEGKRQAKRQNQLERAEAFAQKQARAKARHAARHRAQVRAAIRHDQAEAKAQAAANQESEEAAEAEAVEEETSECDPNYSGCVPRYPPDVDCSEVGETVAVYGEDPHGLDADGDGSGCE